MRVEQLEKCVYDSVMQMKDYHELQKFLSYFGNGNIYQMSIENIFAVYNQKPDLKVGKKLIDIHYIILELQCFLMILPDLLQNFRNLYLIFKIQRAEKFIYGV